MRLARKLVRSVKTLPGFLCSLTVVLTLSLLYVYTRLVPATDISSRHMTSNISARHMTSNSSSLPPQLVDHQTPTPGQPIEADAPSLLNVTCSPHPGAVNFTSCPECLRPSVRQFGNIVTEIGFQSHLTRDGPPNIFNISSVVVQDLVTDYLIQPRFDCPYLLAVQASILGRRQERDTVRNTWGSAAREQTWPNRKINAKFKILFVVASQVTAVPGTQNINTTLQEVRSEAEQHQDILYLNLVDNYRNLAMKLLSAFKWVKDNCPCVKFVLKVDYDTFVNVPLLVDTLLYFENRFEFSILGHVYTERNNVFRRGRWRIPTNIYPMKSFPEYSSGCGYVLSYSALSQIVNAATHVQILPVEDAFITGVMRRVTGCHMFSLGDLFPNYNDKTWNPCMMLDDGKILGTGLDMIGHQRIWESFVRGSCT